MKHKGYNTNVNTLGNATAQKIKYQEQERQDELGLNWDSFKWRNYDYAIGKFMSVDPLAEDYYYNSTYAFQENKIGMGRELEGLEMVPQRSEDGKSVTITYYVKPVNNSRLTNEQFNKVIEARRTQTQNTLSGKTKEGVTLTTKVEFSNDATVSWEYNELLTAQGAAGNELGVTFETGNTQENTTQVNVYSHIGVDGNLGELRKA